MENNLKELCKKAGIKQVSLASEMNVSQSVISDWQNGKTFPSTENLIQLSRILNVSTDCILGLKPVPENYPDVATALYNEAISTSNNVTERPRDSKPTKKAAPFTAEQTAYLEAMEDRIAEKVAETLREDSSLLREAGDAT